MAKGWAGTKYGKGLGRNQIWQRVGQERSSCSRITLHWIAVFQNQANFPEERDLQIMKGPWSMVSVDRNPKVGQGLYLGGINNMIVYFPKFYNVYLMLSTPLQNFVSGAANAIATKCWYHHCHCDITMAFPVCFSLKRATWLVVVVPVLN